MRFAILVVLIASALLIISFATVKAQKTPFIQIAVPAVGSPGDTMIIKGSNFGDRRGTSFVEIGGSRVTASGYLSWSDSEIRLVIPSNVQDGLLIVKTAAGKSKPSFFANETEIPVTVMEKPNPIQTVISSIEPSTCGYGTLLSIKGANFGNTRGKSQVVFSANRDDAKFKQQSTGDKTGELETEFIAANPADFDYEYWSDSEIRVRVPDGAASGQVFIKTGNENSNGYDIKIDVSPEQKKFSGRKTYLVEVYADIENADSKNSTSITLRMPRPEKSSSQPLAEMTECSPAPVLEDFKKTVVYRFELNKSSGRNSQSKRRYKQNYIISSYAVNTNINPKSVKSYDKERTLYKTFTSQDSLIQSKNENAIALAQKITGKEKNPLLKAKLIYDYLLENYNLLENLRKSDSSALDLLKDKKGDAYDFAVFYTTLLRAAEIPAVTMSGILVDFDLQAKNHWWTEFYLEGFGWIPADVALAMGMKYKSFRSVQNAKEFYFGNLDGQHIAFSRGWNELKRTISDSSKIVYRPKTYALQSIWEESSEGKVNYSSLWNDPVVLGIY